MGESQRMLMESPAVAVIGCGYWGKNLVRNLHQLHALHAICDVVPSRLEVLQMQYPGVTASTCYEEMLADQEVQAVAIATPAETHFQLAKQALSAGKDVFVEKPLALHYDQGAELVELARQHRAILMVGHLLEYHPAVEQLEKLIHSGELGTLYYLYSNRLSLGKIRKEENILWSFAPHDISILLRLVGAMPLEVSATGEAYLQSEVADVTMTHLRFPGAVRAHIFVSWLHPYKEQRLVVIGDRKMAVFNDTLQEGKLKVYDKGIELVEGELLPRQEAEMIIDIPNVEPLRLECEHFLKCLQERSQPRTDGENGLRVLKILEMAQRSMNAQGRPFSLETE